MGFYLVNRLTKFNVCRRLFSNCSVLPESFEKQHHIPVLSNEAIEALNIAPGSRFLDFTFGAGGHTDLICRRCSDITVFALDRDPNSFLTARSVCQRWGDKIVPLHGKFSQVVELLKAHKLGLESFDGMLLDAGCSSMQMDQAERGFALSKDGPLDMRMNSASNDPTAADVINTLDVNDLSKIFKAYGEEKRARQIAEAIVEYRIASMKSIRRTRELAEVVKTCFGDDFNNTDSLGRPAHVATKVFMALRIFVNDELNELDQALKLAWYLLKPGGRMCTITFHSLEDRVVKRHFQGARDTDEDIYQPCRIRDTRSNDRVLEESAAYKVRNPDMYLEPEQLDKVLWKPWKLFTKKPIVASKEEIEMNPRSRSAQMRVAEKVP